MGEIFKRFHFALLSTATTTAQNGKNQTHRTQIHRRQSAPQTARDQGRPQSSAQHRRRQKTAQVPPRHRCAARNPTLPEAAHGDRGTRRIPTHGAPAPHHHRIQRSALDLLHKSTEMHCTKTFETSRMLAEHANRQTVKSKDITLATRMTKFWTRT